MRSILPTLAIGLLLVAPAAAGDGLTGSWKFTIHEGRQPTTFWLIGIETGKDGKLTATAEPLRGAPRAKVADIKVVDDLLVMTLKATVKAAQGSQEIQIEYQGKLPKPGAKKILGTMSQGGAVIPVVLEATTAKNQFELDLELLTRTPSDPKVLSTVLDLIERAKENKVAAKDLQSWIDGSMKTAELFGPRMQLGHGQQLLEALQGQKSYPTVAAETARRIGRQIDAKTPIDTQLHLFSMVANVLRGADQKEEAKTLEVRIEKLEGQAYADYEKTALNYKTAKFAGRKAKSNRTVLVELFTGAQCPPCVAADMAFDGLEKTYAMTDVVLLQYHVHIPRAEPMSNPDSDVRFDFYSEKHAKKVRGTPSSLFNGNPEVGGGGFRDDAAEKYKEFCGTVNKLLEAPESVKLSASAVRKGEKIAIAAKVQGLDKPGDKVRLRFALVEDWVRFKGGNGLQYHHRVVRAMPGGAKGVGLKEKDSAHTASVDLDDLRKILNKYLDEEYPDGARPMRLRNLHVVAFVQNDESTEVLQAVNVPVREE